jgi:hypothetical protein
MDDSFKFQKGEIMNGHDEGGQGMKQTLTNK